MRGKFSKKQIGVLSVVALMAMPASVMASEELQTQQEETVAAHEVETELSDLTESVTEPESVQTESLLEIETQAETLESEAEESQVEQSQMEQSEVTEAVSEENLSEELESEAEPELQLETEPLNSNAEDNEARSADNCWWVKSESGRWQYVDHYVYVYNQVLKIDGNYYGFDYNGYMYQDCEFRDLYNGEHRAKADGTLYVSEWYQDSEGYWYYYDETSCKVRGIVEIQGRKYLFDNYSGYLIINGFVYIDNSYYGANENGELIQIVGWHKINERWYYTQEDFSAKYGLIEYEGYTYYMAPYMLTGFNFIEIDGAAYKIDFAGHVTPIKEDGLYESFRSKVYVSNGQVLKNSWKNIDGKWYYFNEYGYMEICDARIDYDGPHPINIDGKYYYFDSNGVMEDNGWVYLCTGTWCYAKPSGELVTGDAWIGEKLYHFSENGILKEGACEENGICAIYDEEGTKLGEITHDGWGFVNGTYYYVENGVAKADGAYKLPDGKWYVFDKSGRMLSSVRAKKRWLSENGDAITGWIKRAGAWYYADPETAETCTGFKEINGVQYYFKLDATMLEGEAVVYNELIMTDENGAIKGRLSLEDGWSYHDGECYYTRNGEPYTGWVGAYYVENGCMLRNQIVQDPTSKKYYWVDEYGVYQTNRWISDGYGYNYAKTDGTLARKEWLTINGTLYYFDQPEYGRALATGVQTIDGIEYLFGTDGSYLCKVEEMKEGWSLINGSYYYKAGGQLTKGWKTKIDGKWYIFAQGYRMLSDGFSPLTDIQEDTDTFGRNSYYKPDGSMAEFTGWQLINCKWYYFDNNSKCLEGWAILNGSRYYFMSFYDTGYWRKTKSVAGEMVTGYRTINGVLYYFDKSGACQGACGPQNGWYYADGDWYYMKGGKVITEAIGVMDYVERQVAAITTINRTEYAFDNLTGKMLIDQIVNSDVVAESQFVDSRAKSLRYVNSDGKVVTTKGWRLTKNGYIYVQSNGTLCTGVHMIDGIVYYFGADGIWIS